MKNPADCGHEDFGVYAEVNRIVDAKPGTAWAMDLTVICSECGTEFEFVGDFPGGLNSQKTTLSPDRKRLSIPLKPEGQTLAASFPGFSVRPPLPPSGGQA
jgi:hypothetical protein